MNFDTEQDDTNSIKLTEFDKLRLIEMSVGDSFENEYGTVKIFKYKKSYSVLLYNHPKHKDFLEFSTLEQLIDFLDK